MEVNLIWINFGEDNFIFIILLAVGILMIVVVVIYPVGWSNQRVNRLCSNNKYDPTKHYYMADCSIGTCFYCLIGKLKLLLFELVHFYSYT